MNECILIALAKCFLTMNITYYPDFPLEGICFKEIYHIMRDPARFNLLTDLCVIEIKYKGWDKKCNRIAMPQSKGFIWGSILAQKLGMAPMMLRKPGKLPEDEVNKVTYDLQYGKDTLEFLKCVAKEGDRFLIIDDCVATGGSLLASVDLITEAGYEVVGSVMIIEIEEIWDEAMMRFPDHEVIKIL